jgi:peptide/nickel transport system ATP-binding protein
MAEPKKTILEVQDLSIAYPISIGVVRAVEGVSFTLDDGEALGLVGESGCGKSTLGLSILKLQRPPGRVTGGRIMYRGTDILGMSARSLLNLRGQKISMIFQNPLTSLNPLFTVKRHFLETIHYHDPGMPREKALAAVGTMLETLGIERKRLAEYPHQLSGGMRQRIMIGLALIMNPDIIIADEPTTSLDVIVEAGFTELLLELRRAYKLSIILITHNLGLVAEIADRIAVMYAGRLMEIAPAEEIFARPLHPYTQGLIACVPNIRADQKELVTMPGSPPDLVAPPPGCRFAPRCPKVMPVCGHSAPPLLEHAPGHSAACWLYGERPAAAAEAAAPVARAGTGEA